MKKIVIVLVIIVCNSYNINAQFGYRVLKKEQSSSSFVKLKYKTFKDSIGTGYGYPNPTNTKSIVFSKTKPEGEKTKDWSELDVKYVEFYNRKSISNLLKRLISSKAIIDSFQSKTKANIKAEKIDTLRVYYLKNMRGGVANGLNSLIYQNKEVRLFSSIIWNNYYIPHNLVFFQTSELPVLESKTYFLNYNNHKAFKRSVKRLFKKCSILVENANEGEYFPRTKTNLRKIADDYEKLCGVKID